MLPTRCFILESLLFGPQALMGRSLLEVVT